MKKFLSGLGILSLVLMLAAPVLASQHEGSVSATVTPQIIAVSVLPADVAYGTLDLSASDVSRTTAESVTITATNDGNVNEDFTIRGSDSDNWTLDFSPADTGTIAVNQFVHRFDAGATFTPAEAAALDTTGKSLATNVVTTADFVLEMNMPLSGSTSGLQTTTVTVVATAI